MRLTWSKPADIAAALLAAYPAADRLSLDHARLTHMISSLPGFDDTSVPQQPAQLDHILWTWMRLADTDTGAERLSA